MSRVIIEGFEGGHINTSIFKTAGNGFSVSSNPPAGFTGTYYGNCNGGWCYARTDLENKYPELYLAVKVRVKQRTGHGPGVFAFYDQYGIAMASCFFEYFSPVFKIQAMLSAQNSGVTLATGSIEIAENGIALVEVYYKPHKTTGIFKIKINGTLDVNFSGNTTAGSDFIQGIRIGSSGIDSYQSGFDDFVVDDADWIGTTRIQKLQANAVGAVTQWDPSAGDNYECVDEIPYSDADYIKTGVAEESDTYGCADLTESIQSIQSVQIDARALGEGLLSREFKGKAALRVNGSEYYGPAKHMGFSVGHVRGIWSTNPDDSQPWSEADVNAVEIGVSTQEVTTSTSTSSTTTSIIPMSGMELWLDADDDDTLSILSDYVTQWRDKSGNERHAVQETVADKWELVTGSPNGRQHLSSAEGDYFVLDSDVSNLRHLFIVEKCDGHAAIMFLLGHSTTWHFHGGTVTVFDATNTSANIRNGVMKLDGVNIDLVTNDYSGNWECLVLETLGDVEFNQITEDRTYARHFLGDFAEVIAYNRILSTAEKKVVSDYLSNKWGTPAYITTTTTTTTSTTTS